MRTTIPFLYLAILVATHCAATSTIAGQSEAKRLAGQYSSGEGESRVALDLREQGDLVVGALHVGDSTYSLSARATDDGFAGTFEAEGARFALSGVLRGAEMEIESEGNRFRLRRVVNPLAARSDEAGQIPVDVRFGRSYRHARGEIFVHPEPWTRRRLHGVDALIPDGVPEIPGFGPCEYYLPIVSDWSLGADLRAEEAINALAATVLRFVPFLKQDGPERLLDTSDPSRIRLSFATEFGIGLDISADLYARVRDGRIVLLLAVGEKSLIQKRRAETEAMFALVRRESGRAQSRGDQTAGETSPAEQPRPVDESPPTRP